MTLNSPIIKKIFLPLTFISLAIFAGELNAKAEETNPISQAKQSPSQRAIASELRTASTTRTAIAQPTSQTKATPGTVATRGAALLGEPSISANTIVTASDFTTSSTFRLTQTTPSSPSIDTPGRAVPGSAPAGTPTNPVDVSPDTTTPNTTPGITTPDPTITPGTTPDTTIPTTPDTTTPTTPTETQPFAPAIDPGRATRSGSSYVGVGGNIGIGSGDTALGEGSFAVISKIGLTRQFSVRPAVLFTDDVTILLPVTYDFSFGEGPTGDFGFTAAPFLGVGAAISTGDGGDVGFLLTGGIDVPISPQFTATASVNASVTGEAAVGILVGVGYNFAGF